MPDLKLRDSDNDSIYLADNVPIIWGSGADVNDASAGDCKLYFDGTDLLFESTTAGTSFKFDIDTVLNLGAQANTAGSGVPISSTETAGLALYCDDAGANIGTSGMQSRFLLTTDATGSTVRALQGQLKLTNGTDVGTGIYTANQGYVELMGTHSANSGATFSCFDASLEIGTALTVASGGEFYGVHVETTGSGTITNNGTCAAIGITGASGAAAWPVQHERHDHGHRHRDGHDWRQYVGHVHDGSIVVRHVHDGRAGRWHNGESNQRDRDVHRSRY